MKFSQFRDFLIAGLSEPQVERWPSLEFYPGPRMPDDTANRFVVLTRFGGPGLTTEDVIDIQGWQIRVAGNQNDYNDAEDLAFALDAVVLNRGHSQAVDGLWMADAYRTGSPPTELLVDDAERTHFVASYLVSVQSALVT